MLFEEKASGYNDRLIKSMLPVYLNANGGGGEWLSNFKALVYL